MAKRQKNIRISEATDRKLAVLSGPDYYGTDVEAISIAVDRLYRTCRPTDVEHLRAGIAVRCAKCGKPIQPSEDWITGASGEAYHRESAVG